MNKISFTDMIEKIKNSDWAIGERGWTDQLRNNLGNDHAGMFFITKDVKITLQSIKDLSILVLFNENEQRSYYLQDRDVYFEVIKTLSLSDENVKKVTVRSIKNNKKRYAYADELGILKNIPNESLTILIDEKNNWRLYHDSL